VGYADDVGQNTADITVKSMIDWATKMHKNVDLEDDIYCILSCRR